MVSVSAGSFISFPKNSCIIMPDPTPNLEESIQSVRGRSQAAAGAIVSQDDLEKFRIEFLARKGSVGQLFDELKLVPSEQKPNFGKQLNELRNFVDSLYQSAKEKIESTGSVAKGFIDLTLPGRRTPLGSRHPITQTLEDLSSIFTSMGFGIVDGPEIEDDYHNFEALNFPPIILRGTCRIRSLSAKIFCLERTHRPCRSA